MNLPPFYLADLVDDSTPYLKFCVPSSKPATQFKHGIGPRWRNEEEKALADYSEKKLVRMYINNKIRAELFLACSPSEEIPPCADIVGPPDFLAGEMRKAGLTIARKFLQDTRPLRTNDKFPIDPKTIQVDNGIASARLNPEWVNARDEYAFWFMPGITIPVSLTVERESRCDSRYQLTFYKICIAVSCPPSGQFGMIKFPRT